MEIIFKLAEKEEIWQYLINRIDERFESHRQFCVKYLEINSDEPTDCNQIRKMSNRLSQILNGNKEIQLYDLPLFCRLLEVSCEDILSAGKSHAPASMRLTNYTVAFSKDERDWKAFVNREDSPILNADEYGKTFIDYALEAENYNLLKYLMDNQFIWFVGTDPKDFFVGFGAGTSIEKAIFPYPKNWNVLNAQLKMRDELRTHMIALAIQHKNIEMLEHLHAKEIPTLYQVSFYSSPPPTTCGQYYNPKLMETLVHADDKILEYFSGEIKIIDRVGFTNRFLFPFIGELIERLLQNKNSFTEYMLKDAIRHNQYVYDQLVSLLAAAVKFYREINYDITNTTVKNDLTKGILKDLYFYDEGSLVSYFAMPPRIKKGLRSNIIHVNAKSTDAMLNRRISELNDLYDAIHHIMPEFERDTK
ncbi:MAG: hypothetical protein HFG41_09195 [Coprococcus sp.]|nr:hypothetical protein [Coprococcus sp.]